MLSLDLTHQSKDSLGKLDPKQFRQLVKKIFSLMENPKPGDAVLLQGYPFWRTDMGEYRIVYRVEQDCLKIVVVGKRNDDEVYKKLKNLL